MVEGAGPALGLSIGATNLAAVTADLAIIRKPVLTLYRQRPPEVGVPSENPRLDEPGLVIANFVDRVGNSAGILATDGSAHRSEVLVADALRALAYAATGGRSLPDDRRGDLPRPLVFQGGGHPGRRAQPGVRMVGSRAPAVADPRRRGDVVRRAGQSGHTRPRDRGRVRFRRQRDQHHVDGSRRQLSGRGPDRAVPRFLRRRDRPGGVGRCDG